MRRLLLDLDPYGGTNPLGMFSLFLKRTDVMASRLSVVFRRLVRLGSFPACGDRPMSPQFCSLAFMFFIFDLFKSILFFDNCIS